ncbi:uncharacterized protein LOC119584769 [Penaeus monodon]|uniref:uncharacterized protein LOC119584769 n=1 Tax=Penaeus monodon TaxID=6687 RepID=UPI0018A7A582|nr:uncharacterized protein LOC119584769 [Penaeus monodon]
MTGCRLGLFISAVIVKSSFSGILSRDNISIEHDVTFGLADCVTASNKLVVFMASGVALLSQRHLSWRLCVVAKGGHETLRGGFAAALQGVGHQVQIFEILMNYLGRCHEWVIPEIHSYGYQYPNGSWVGLIGSVHSGRADLSMALGHTIDRTQVVDFSENLYMEEFAIAYKRPKLTSDIIGFTRPFALSLWITVFVATLFVCATSWLILRSHSALSDSRRPGRDGDPGAGNRTRFLRDVEESVPLDHLPSYWSARAAGSRRQRAQDRRRPVAPVGLHPGRGVPGQPQGHAHPAEGGAALRHPAGADGDQHPHLDPRGKSRP